MQIGNSGAYVPILALVVSTLALLISFWTRLEAYTSLKRQRKIELVRRLGEVFVAAQHTKNEISDLIDRLKAIDNGNASSLSPPVRIALAETLRKAENNYQTAWELVRGFELLVIEFERGGHISLETSVVEAKIARFSQVRALATFDSASAEKLLAKAKA